MKSITGIPKKENIMFEQLKPQTQAQIKHLLLMNDFRAAKALYDKSKRLDE